MKRLTSEMFNITSYQFLCFATFTGLYIDSALYEIPLRILKFQKCAQLPCTHMFRKIA